MGLVISYDETFGAPNSEIELASGERVFLSLGHEGLSIKLLPAPGRNERLLFEADPEIVAKICDGFIDIQPGMRATPLSILVAVAHQLPDSRTLEDTFRTAARP